jgi:hypothetical protein
MEKWQRSALPPRFPIFSSASAQELEDARVKLDQQA